MPGQMDRAKIEKIFRQVYKNEDITPGEFEDMIASLEEDELLYLRELLVNARCNAIRMLAERGWPAMRRRIN